MKDGELPEKPSVPDDLQAPGLIYRFRRHRWAMYWCPRSDLTKRGYQGKTVRLWPSDRVPPQQIEPGRAEWEFICGWCERYHAEQVLWTQGGATGKDPQSLFDGTIGSLIEIYQTHERSPFNGVRHSSQLQYTSALASLKAAIGKVRVKQVTFDDIARWQDELADPGDGGKRMKARSANLIGQLKRVINFGTLVLPKPVGCHDVREIFKAMAEERMLKSTTGRRKEYMTAAQCRLLRIKAHELGWHSVALEQALAFELGVRQTDVIGQWLPIGWPGVTDIIDDPRKWMIGMRWEEIDANLILTHRLSKSLRGKDAMMDADAGKVKVWDLRDYPMIMDELRRITGSDMFGRADLPASGPLIVNENTGRPWERSSFKDRWRLIAKAAGLPASLQNRDSRPGAATEADLAGAPEKKIQRGLGHSRMETTEIYLREDLEVNRELARLRRDKRKP